MKVKNKKLLKEIILKKIGENELHKSNKVTLAGIREAMLQTEENGHKPTHLLIHPKTLHELMKNDLFAFQNIITHIDHSGKIKLFDMDVVITDSVIDNFGSLNEWSIVSSSNM